MNSSLHTLPFYECHLGDPERHLDVGAGASYYPAHVLDSIKKPKTSLKGVTDINQNTLDLGSKRLRSIGYGRDVDTVNHNVSESVEENSGLWKKFDSISLFYVFHCLPGSFPKKGRGCHIELGQCVNRGQCSIWEYHCGQRKES